MFIYILDQIKTQEPMVLGKKLNYQVKIKLDIF